jgi:redox-sensitive bicupin YhaK (pirin superfamily)
MTEPRLAFIHAEDVPKQEVVAQMHGGRRVSVWSQFLEFTERRMVALVEYDPGLVLERHQHKSDHTIYIIEGEVSISGHRCTPGTLIVLEKGATFGPMITGPAGCRLLEHYAGDPMPVPVDKEEYYGILRERSIERLPNPRYSPPEGAPSYAYDGSGDVAS